MDPNLYQAASQQPSQGLVAQLYALAVSPGDAVTFETRLRKSLLLVAALLLARGLIFWIAANWQQQTRMFRLSLIEGALLFSVLAACLWPRARLAALLCATLVLGGLLALVGQTYQTGADAWQLFAVWAALSLVWVGLARSDVLWLLWVLIVAVGLVTWMGRLDLWHVFYARFEDPLYTGLNMGLWLALAVVPALVSFLPFLRVQGGMGWWSHRVALACVLTVWTGMAMVGLFESGSGGNGLFGVVLLLTVGCLLLSLNRRFRDFVAVCLTTLALNVLVLSAVVARWLKDMGGEGGLLLMGLLAFGCLGLSVRWLLAVQQRMRVQHKEVAA